MKLFQFKPENIYERILWHLNSYTVVTFERNDTLPPEKTKPKPKQNKTEQNKTKQKLIAF